MKMGWSLVNWYNICKDDEKLANHILIHCDKIWKFWTLLLTTFGWVWVFLVSVKNLLLKWKFKGVGKKKKKFDSWLWFIYFDVFGENAIKGYWKIKNCHTKGWVTLFPFPRGVVPAVFEFGNSLSSKFFGGSLVWLTLLLSKLFLELVFGVFWSLLIEAFCQYKKRCTWIFKYQVILVDLSLLYYPCF